MRVTGTIVDQVTDSPLPGASVQIVNTQGDRLQGGAAVNNKGQFDINSALLDQNNLLLFTHVGYQSVITNPDIFKASDYPEVGLAILPQGLDESIVNATVNYRKKRMILWGIIAAIVIAGAAYAKKRKRSISGMSETDWKSIALKIGIAVAVYYLVVVPILQKLGILKTKDEKAVATARDAAIKAETQKQLAAQAPTYSDADLSSIADSLFEAVRYSWVDDNYDNAEMLLRKMKNTSDVYKLIEIFGKRDECLFGIICSNMSLPEMIKRNLSTKMIESINKYYSSNGIKFTW